ncbi:MAG: Putative diheme cytochrome c-553 [uncultured Cytophagales bacterium]|uniref:Diheme cytochrome c-553 n=1 Tax=uncultured Cytophagales bacterium TaxID=158755 RepID=A0A6J4K9B7_9SPHI|nr:MAG: Putative diheme cytochrome c-553 [uncultured Cytophagales bacterium]
MRLLRKALRWTGMSLGLLFLASLVAYSFVFWRTQQRLDATYPVETLPIQVPGDPAALTRGEHVFRSRGCADCHGKDLGGRMFLDNPALGRIAAPNLTRGDGGLPADFGPADWLRVLKHGVDREGKPLVIMPSHETTQFSDKDLADLIAYCRSRPAVDHALPRKPRLGPVARLLMVAGKLDLPAERIDHTPRSVAEVTPAVTVAYGVYLAVACTGCHRGDFRGGEPVAPGFPPVPDITATGRPGQWTEAQFIRTLRTGIRPDGHRMRNQDMPWQMTREFSDLELKAIRLHLLSLPYKGVLTAGN